MFIKTLEAILILTDQSVNLRGYYSCHENSITPKEKRVNRRRSDILAAAEKVFAAKGYTEATVDEIATQAGISKGSVYNYFESKQTLFAELFLQSLVEDEAEVAALVEQDKPARVKFEEILQAFFHRFTKYNHLGRLVLEF